MRVRQRTIYVYATRVYLADGEGEGGEALGDFFEVSRLPTGSTVDIFLINTITQNE